MTKKEHNHAEKGKRYLKKFEVVETEVELPIQAPDEEGKKLMRALQADSQVLSFKPFFADFIIVAQKSYFSMATRRHGWRRPSKTYPRGIISNL